MATWADIQRGIFAGESGGDYGALYGYANRPDGLFSDVNLQDMTVAEVMDFTSPSGPYGQYVASLNEGTVATPVGAYQVVGTTLRDAAKALGLTGSERFDKATQDRIGQWVYNTQGTGAWEGYQGPQSGGQDMPQDTPQGILGMVGGNRPQQDQGRFWGSDRQRDLAGRIAMAANTLRQRPDQNITAAVMGAREQRAGNRTAEWLAQQPGGELYAQMISAGVDPGMALAEYKKATAGPSFRQVRGADLGLTGPQAEMMFNVGADGKVTQVGGGGTTINMPGDMTEAEKARLQYQMDVMVPLAKSGRTARATLGQTQTLEALLGQTETGFGTGLATWAKDNLGLNVADDAAVAANAIISQLVPAQRPAGSGTMSDADLALYKASLPKLSNTPEGNQIIIDGMKAMAAYNLATGQIADRFASGLISYEDAIAQMNEVPDPMADVVARIKSGGYAEGADDAAVQDIVTDSQGVRWQYKGTGDRNDKSNYTRLD